MTSDEILATANEANYAASNSNALALRLQCHATLDADDLADLKLARAFLARAEGIFEAMAIKYS